MTTRALVLGGGGTVGIAWETGLLAGLAKAGVHLAEADLIVGTSAGSVVGTQLALGHVPAELLARQLEPSTAAPPQYDLPRLMAVFQLISRPSPETAREIGALSVAASTGTEAHYLERFSNLVDVEWPLRKLILTGVETTTGAYQAWDAAAGVSLQQAVAASCAVPGIFPPITIGEQRYMDGGIRSANNADLARDYDVVVVITPISSAGGNPLGSQSVLDAELAVLREAGGRVEVISPDAAATQAFGSNLMDASKQGPAAEAGLRQAEDVLERLKAIWQL